MFLVKIVFKIVFGNSAKDIHSRMFNVFKEHTPKYSTVTKWAAEFKDGRRSHEDDPRSGRPSEFITPTTIALVEEKILQDRRFKIIQLVMEIGVSYSSVSAIIHDHLQISKVSARWVPRNLRPYDRLHRVTSSQLLELYSRNSAIFKRQLVTGDETRIHLWDPETKQESIQWKHTDSPPLYTTIRWQDHGLRFLGQQGVILIDFFDRCSTIIGKYYTDLITQLNRAIKDKRRGKLTQRVLFLHENTPVHKARVSQARIHDCDFQHLNHPPHSPDLTSSDFHLFHYLKKHLRGHRVVDDKEKRYIGGVV